MRPHSITFEGKGRTKQSHRDECDINTIMKRFEKTGMLEHANQYEGSYGDFTQIPEDYQSAVNLVQNAQQMFMSLPAEVRGRFENDPGEFLAFVSNRENRDEMLEMGLIPQPPQPETVPEPVPEATEVVPRETVPPNPE